MYAYAAVLLNIIASSGIYITRIYILPSAQRIYNIIYKFLKSTLNQKAHSSSIHRQKVFCMFIVFIHARLRRSWEPRKNMMHGWLIKERRGGGGQYTNVSPGVKCAHQKERERESLLLAARKARDETRRRERGWKVRYTSKAGFGGRHINSSSTSAPARALSPAIAALFPALYRGETGQRIKTPTKRENQRSSVMLSRRKL